MAARIQSAVSRFGKRPAAEAACWRAPFERGADAPRKALTTRHIHIGRSTEGPSGSSLHPVKSGVCELLSRNDRDAHQQGGRQLWACRRAGDGCSIGGICRTGVVRRAACTEGRRNDDLSGTAVRNGRCNRERQGVDVRWHGGVEVVVQVCHRVAGDGACSRPGSGRGNGVRCRECVGTSSYPQCDDDSNRSGQFPSIWHRIIWISIPFGDLADRRNWVLLFSRLNSLLSVGNRARWTTMEIGALRPNRLPAQGSRDSPGPSTHRAADDGLRKDGI